MIKRYQIDDNITYKFDRVGPKTIQISDNLSCFTIAGSNANTIKNQLYKIENLGSAVKKIGDYCFYGCDGLTLINMNENNVEEFGEYSFGNCHGIQSFHFGDKQKGISPHMFDGDTSLNYISFNGFESDAFQDLNKVEDVSL